MTAPASVVAAVQEENGCRFVDELRSRVVDGVRQGVAEHFHCCANHPWETWRKRGCPISVRQADAAWAAAYPAALRDAAERLDEAIEADVEATGEATIAQVVTTGIGVVLRRWADESEA